MLSRLLNLILIVGLLFSGMPLTTISAAPLDARLGLQTEDIAATIDITAAGFMPDQVTIQVGETVAWVNTTTRVQSITGGPVYRIFLPLVVSAQSAQRTALDSPTGATLSRTVDWSSGDIQPGGRFTYTFSSQGDHPYFLTGNPGLAGLVRVEGIPLPDFDLSVSPAAQETIAGGTAIYTVTLTALHGFSAPVNLAVDNLPPGAEATWEKNPLTPTASTRLTITTEAQTPPGSYTPTLTAQSGLLSHSISLALSIAELPCTPVTGATVSSNSPVELGQMAYLTATVSPAGATEPVTYTWDVGDGPVTGDTSVTHTFAVTGTFPVTVSVANPCGSASGSADVIVAAPPPQPDFELTVTPSSREIHQGEKTTFNVTLAALAGFTTPVALSVAGLPTGVTAAWGSNPVMPDGNTSVTVTTSLATPVGAYTLTISAAGGGQSHTAQVTLLVSPAPDFALTIEPEAQAVVQGTSVAYTVTVTALHGFSDGVFFSLDGLPSGAAVTLSANPVAPSGSAILTVTTTSQTAVGTHALSLVGSGGGRIHGVPFTLTLTPHPDFALGVQPTSRTVAQTGSVTYTVQLTAEHGFADPVTLAVSGLPAGITAAIAPNPVTPTGTAGITLTTELTATVGTHALTLVGGGGGRAAAVSFALIVTPYPEFAIAADPTQGSVRQGNVLTTEVTVLGVHGFDSAVDLALGGLPAGVTYAWSTDTVIPDASATLTLTTAIDTPVGDHTLLITGTGGGFRHAIAYTLTVLPLPDFTFAVTPTEHTIIRGATVDFDVLLTALYGWATAVDLSVQGLPAEASGAWDPATLVPDGNSRLSVTTTDVALPGSYPLLVLADGGSVSHTVPITLHIQQPPAPDLIIQSITTDPLAPTLNVPFTLTVVVANLGGATATPFEVSWYANPGTEVLTATTPTGLWQVAGLGADMTETLTATHMFTTTGDHTLWAYADSTDVVPEGDETNNVTGPVTTTVEAQVVSICGNISGVWTTGTVYVVTCRSSVSAGETLLLEPGVIVKFHGTSSGIMVYGDLDAQGAAAVPIVFTSFRDDAHGGDTNGDGGNTLPANGDWGDLWIANGGSVTLERAVVSYGGYQGRGSITVNGGTLSVNASMIHNSGASTNHQNYGAVYALNGGVVSIANSHLYDNSTTSPYAAVKAIDSTLVISNSVLQSTCYGVWWEGTNLGLLSLTDNEFSDNTVGFRWQGTDLDILLVTGNRLIGNAGSVGHLNLINADGTPIISSNTADGNALNGIELAGAISGTVALPNNPLVPYVTSGLTVNAGGTLNLAAGNVLKFTSTDPRGSLGIHGSLDVQGTPDSPVVFTSIRDDAYGGDTNNDGDATLPTPGDWRFIWIGPDATATFDHALVQYGGYYPYSYPEFEHYRALLSNTGTLTIRNSQLRHSHWAGVYSSAGSLTITSSAITENPRGARLINQQAVISETLFDSNSIGISYRATSPPRDLALFDNVFTNNTAYPISIDATGSGNAFYTNASLLQGNTGSDNDYNGIHIRGNITGTTSLAPQPGLPFLIEEVAVLEGQTLVLLPGVIVKFTSTGPRGSLGIHGSLDVQGTPDNPVVFTSIRDDAYGGDTNNDGDATLPTPGDWRFIWIGPDATATFDHALVQYGGYYPYSYPEFEHYRALLSNTGTLTIRNSQLRHSHWAGVYSSAGSLTITSSVVASNGRGIRLNHHAYLRYNTFENNAQHAVYNANSDIVVDARYNWWGSSSGPAPYGSGNGINYTTSCSGGICTIVPYVNVIPWIGQQTYYGPNVPNVAYDGDPVNTANGNYSYQPTDLFIVTRGLPLAFVRTYNALAPEDGPLGWGWRHSWQISVQEMGDDVRITYGDGRQVRFIRDGDAYVGDAGVFSTLVRSGDIFHLTEKDQTVYHLDVEGRLASVEDRNGNTTTLTYDTQGRLAAVTEPAGRTLVLAYTSPVSTTLLTQITDPASRSVQFSYSAAGELVTVTDVNGQITTYTYDADHRLLTATDANEHTFVRNVYDNNGRVVEQYDAKSNLWAFTYDEVDRRTIVTDPLGRSTVYQYDDLLRLTSERDALSHTASYDYDDDNNRTQVIDKRGFTTRLVYDARGNTTLITDALGYTQVFTYSTLDQLTRAVDPLGNTTVYTYNLTGDLVALQDALGAVTRWAHNAYGQAMSVTDALARTTRFGYDSYGHQTVITDALGGVTTYVFDVVGRQISETDPTGQTAAYSYDGANRLLTVTEPLGRVTAYTYDPVGNRIAITDPRGGVTTFAYDDQDRLIATTDPLGRSVTFGYDAVGNQITLTDALNHTTVYGYDALNRKTHVTDPLTNTTTYAYDANGNQTAITDANGNTTSYTYDALGRLVTVTDAESGVVTYAYDANGNRIEMVDGNGHITTYAYDALSRLITTTNPLLYTTVYTYDALGNRVARQKPDGTVLQYSYDDLDRMTAIVAPGLSIAYGYDEVGNRTIMTDSTGITTYDYDALYRLTQVTAPTGTLQHDYDLNGNRTGLVYPNGKEINYTYDLTNRLIDVTDWRDQSTTYTYDEAGRQISIAHGNDTLAIYTYDAAGGLLSVRHSSPVSGTIGVFTYTLDAVGNRMAMEDLEGATTYAYDDLYRLSEVTYPDGEIVTYAYDPMGNRTAMTSTVTGVVIYTYDAADRLLAFTGSAGTTALTWDQNGNMTGKGSATYTFDALDRLTEAVSGTTTVGFAYNGDGVRVGKTVNGQTTDYVQDIAAPLPLVVVETTGSGTNHYVYGNDLISVEDSAGGVTTYHQDGLGSTRGLSNGAGELTDAYSYDVFGTLRSHSGDSGQAFTFTGEQVDAELGLVFLRARYYDPEVGRFVSQDIFAGFTDDPQSLNRYTYVQGNPVLLSDPSGEVAAFLVGGAVGGIAGFAGYSIKTAFSPDDWNWGKFFVAGGGGAIVGATIPIAAAAIASGAVAPGALGTFLGVKGSTALVGAEIAGIVGMNKSILNQQLDSAPIDWDRMVGRAVKEGVVDAPFGALAGFSAGASALKALASGALQPGGLSYASDLSLGQIGQRLLRSLGKGAVKSLIKDLWHPSSVHSVYQVGGSFGSSGGGYGGGGGGSWGGPPSQDK